MCAACRAPFYPFFPAFALFAATICLIAMIYYNLLVFGIFVALLAIGYGYFLTTQKRREESPLDDLIESSEELKAETI